MKLFTLLFFIFFIGCKQSKIQIPAIKCDTVMLSREIIVKHDTLVIMITRDSLPYPKKDGSFYMLPGGWEIGSINMFDNGKTIDTIKRHEIIYY